MAQQPFQGLFGNQPDVRRVMNAERDARISNRFDEVSRSGGFLPAMAAEGQQRMVEAIRGGGNAVMGGLGLGRDDPRILKEAKRNSDKKDIMNMLGQFTSKNSKDGEKLSEQEIKVGFSELMKRGYPEEAQKWLKMAQSMQGMDIKQMNAKSRQQTAAASTRNAATNASLVPVKKKRASAAVMSAEASRLNAELKRDGWKPSGTTVYTTKDGIDYSETPMIDVKGNTRTVVRQMKNGRPVGPRFRTSEELITQATSTAQGVAAVEGLSKMKVDLGKIMKGNYASMNTAKKALAILPKVTTGGAAEVGKTVTDWLGITDKNVGQFNNLMGERLIQMIGQFGANPTEGERKFAESVSAGMRQGKKVNEAILRDLIKTLDAQEKRNRHYMTAKTMGQYNEMLSKNSKGMSEDNAKLLQEWAGATPSSTSSATTPSTGKVVDFSSLKKKGSN